MWALTMCRNSGGYREDKAGFSAKQGTGQGFNAPRNANSRLGDLVKLITSKRSKGQEIFTQI